MRDPGAAPPAPSHASTAFVFAAQGTSWHGMGRDLLAEDETFRDAVAQCDASIRRHFAWSLHDELLRDVPETSALSYRKLQPTLTSLQIALARTLVARGVTPKAVGALSMGEAAAAHSAGVLDLDAAIDLACSTARLADTELPAGLMAFLRADATRAAELLAAFAGRVCVAVELADDCTVLSGEKGAIGELLLLARSRGIDGGALPLAQAYHSAEVAVLREPFLERLSRLRPRPALLPIYSSATAERAHAGVAAIDHWWSICSRPARFLTLARRMIRDGYSSFIEIGPHPMLASALEQAGRAEATVLQVHAVMRRGVGAREALARTVDALSQRVPKGELG
jgi:myxalamid-type polyketide synthase MxaE and MxaD